jgi:signal transduction histidine kinase
VPVRADDVLADVVRNVVTNAVRHDDVEGLVVSASAAVGGDRVTVRIADNAGVPPDRQETSSAAGGPGWTRPARGSASFSSTR